MESFSQRKGIKPVRTEIQRESMDDDLRIGLWNVLYIHCFETNRYDMVTNEQHKLTKILWILYFKSSIDESGDFDNIVEYTKNYFKKCKWYEVYDLIELILQTYHDEDANEKLKLACNTILELYLSAYRFVGDKIVEITSEEEIAEIESALQTPISPVKEHINCALKLLSDRTNPDYRNSIKESISAVESICKLIVRRDNANLQDSLREIEGKGISLHGKLRGAFNNLYGYTSEASGIRHGLTDEPNLYSEDARFMLVTCSAFINYLSEKASKAGINLQ